ncbi:hypothetical protein COO60DRAFT_1546036 [Scenedesmus sp. NREL 46B-D3]|nr:hypothetical protein COO60DRAFT_1546036 [Scenedesmus sp. NREL 46B-D3]
MMHRSKTHVAPVEGGADCAVRLPHHFSQTTAGQCCWRRMSGQLTQERSSCLICPECLFLAWQQLLKLGLRLLQHPLQRLAVGLCGRHHQQLIQHLVELVAGSAHEARHEGGKLCPVQLAVVVGVVQGQRRCRLAQQPQDVLLALDVLELGQPLAQLLKSHPPVTSLVPQLKQRQQLAVGVRQASLTRASSRCCCCRRCRISCCCCCCC